MIKKPTSGLNTFVCRYAFSIALNKRIKLFSKRMSHLLDGAGALFDTRLANDKWFIVLHIVCILKLVLLPLSTEGNDDRNGAFQMIANY